LASNFRRVLYATPIRYAELDPTFSRAWKTPLYTSQYVVLFFGLKLGNPATTLLNQVISMAVAAHVLNDLIYCIDFSPKKAIILKPTLLFRWSFHP
jgi:hypothetical protein